VVGKKEWRKSERLLRNRRVTHEEVNTGEFLKGHTVRPRGGAEGGPGKEAGVRRGSLLEVPTFGWTESATLSKGGMALTGRIMRPSTESDEQGYLIALALVWYKGEGKECTRIIGENGGKGGKKKRLFSGSAKW